MRITTRLNLISSGTIGALLLVALVVLQSFVDFRKAKNNANLATQIQMNYFERTADRDQYLLHREGRSRAMWFQCNQEAERLIAQARARFTGEGNQEILEHLERGIGESAAIFRRIAGATGILDQPSRGPLALELDKRLVSQLLLREVALRDAVAALLEASETMVERTYRRLAIIVGLFAVSLALLTVLSSLQIARLLRGRLVPIHAGVTCVAGGDLDFRLASSGDDEFSDLARSINAMTEKLQIFTRRMETEIQERKLSELLEGVDACIYLKDVQGRYLFANRLLCETMGLEKEQLMGPVEGSGPGPLAQLGENDRLVFQEGRTVKGEETLLNVKTGCSTTFWSVKQPVRDENGTIYALCGVLTDLTERRQLEAKLGQAQKMQSLGSLAGGVAHDMNNVLGAILGLASAHLTVADPGSPAYRAFETIAKAANRGGAMVKGLLGFARQTPAENLPLDMNELLREEVRLLARTTLAKVRLELDLAPDLRVIRGDAGALSHAIMNLCVNAVDAMPENGVLLLRSRNLDPDQIEVGVEDTGTGMEKEVLEKALDPFFTTKEQGKGTGLGLSMVYSAMAAHKGQMLIQSAPGRGTQVLLRFPAWGAAGSAPESVTPPAPPGETLDVLLVDDDDLVQESIGGLLGMMGHRVSSVSCGEEALARLEGDDLPDVVILDMNMPGLGGAGTLPRLRARHPGLPVLLATGRADQAALDLVAAYPGVTLLAKPFTLEDLRARLGAARVT